MSSEQSKINAMTSVDSQEAFANSSHLPLTDDVCLSYKIRENENQSHKHGRRLLYHMQRNLSQYLNTHVFAWAGATLLHTGLAAWAMQPSAPIAIPQQQVIQIAMVSAAVASDAQPEPMIPQKPEGMKKLQRKPKKEQVKAEKKQQPKEKASVASTSGVQSPEATEWNAAVTEPVYNAAYLRNPSPAYPNAAKRRGVEGKVMLEVKVTADGSASAVNVARSSGSDVLDKAARDAVIQWRFIPAKRGSETVAATVIVPIEFRLS